MNKKTVDISVLITNYNHAQYLPECLDAVFSQSVSPKEVIVIDDASTDRSIEVISKYQEKFPSLILLRNEKNLGPAKNMNLAIQAAKSKYIVLAAADDRVLPGLLEEAAFYLDQNPNVGICCSNPSMFRNHKVFKMWTAPISHLKSPTQFLKEDMVHLYLHSPLWIPTHASLYRKDLVLKYGSLDEKLKHICDWYLNCKIALHHGIMFVPTSYGAFRVSEHSYGATWNRSYLKKLTLYKELFHKISIEPKDFKRRLMKSGALGLISSDVLLYLLTHISLWGYFPFAFYRKCLNFFRKLNLGIR